MVVPSLVSANGYPTAETVRMVVICMAEMGDQNEENLFACSCRQDILESELTFAAYEQASLYERYIPMPGKRGNLFRDSERGREYVKQLEAVREKATTACPVVKRVTRDTVK